MKLLHLIQGVASISVTPGNGLDDVEALSEWLKFLRNVVKYL